MNLLSISSIKNSDLNVWHPYRLTKEFEAGLPKFSNHEEAKIYFIDKFKNNFIQTHQDFMNGIAVYYFDLIVHEENYNYLKDQLRKGNVIYNSAGALSYHPVAIWEDGQVYIVY